MKHAPIIALVLLISTITHADANPLADNEGQLTLTYFPLSYHFDRDHDYNEQHKGIGLGIGVGHGWTAGLMRFDNSFGDKTTMFSMDKHIGCWKELCFGAGGGYAWGYDEHMMIPMAAWGSVRWKMIRISLIPGVVTTLSFTIPLTKFGEER